MVRSLSAATAALAALAAFCGWPEASLAAPPKTPTHTLGCISPVGPHDTAAALRTRFGGRARVERVSGAEGGTMRALVVFPGDNRRRFEVVFADRAMTRPSRVTVRARNSIWSLAGLHIGDTIEKTSQINRGAFDLSGFEWDYGGNVRDFGRGALGHMPGGCTVSMRFRPNASRLETNLLGDRTIRSNYRGLSEARATISEMSIGWPGR